MQWKKRDSGIWVPDSSQSAARKDFGPALAFAGAVAITCIVLLDKDRYVWLPYFGVILWCSLFGTAFFHGMSFDPAWLLDESPKWQPRPRNSCFSILQTTVVVLALLVAPASTALASTNGAIFVSFAAGTLLGTILAPPTYAEGEGQFRIIKNYITGLIWKGMLVGLGGLLTKAIFPNTTIYGGLGVWIIAMFFLYLRVAAARGNLALHNHGEPYRGAVSNLTGHGLIGLYCAFLLTNHIPIGTPTLGAIFVGLAVSHIFSSIPSLHV